MGNGGNGYQGLGGSGSAGNAPGGGGAAAYNGAGGSGGAGGAGRVVITFTSCIPTTPGTISGYNVVCSESSNTYSVDPVSGAVAYTWTLPSGWSGTSATESITVTAGNAGGTISVTAVNACGSSPAQNISVEVAALPQVRSYVGSNYDLQRSGPNDHARCGHACWRTIFRPWRHREPVRGVHIGCRKLCANVLVHRCIWMCG